MNVQLSSGYRWVSEFRCPWQIAFKRNWTWNVTQESPESYLEVAGKGGYATPLFWSDDGSLLLGTEGLGEFIRVAFGSAGQYLQRQSITPLEWRANPKPVWSARWYGVSGEMYCLVGLPGSLEAWSVSRDGTRAQNVAPGEVLSSSPYDTVLNAVSEHAFIIHAQSIGSRHFVILRSRTGSVSHEHSVQNHGMPYWFTASHNGRFCLFSVGKDLARRVLYVLNLDTGVEREIGTGIAGAWSPDDKYIAALRTEGELILLDHNATRFQSILCLGQPRDSICPEESYATSPAWSADGKWLIATLASRRERNSECSAEEFPSDVKAVSRRGTDLMTLLVDLENKVVSTLGTVAFHFAWCPARRWGGRYGDASNNQGSVQ